jgi:hypothetical protein
MSKIYLRHWRDYPVDLEILNRAVDRLSKEAEETLEYQADPWRPEIE